jgi:hypothetical protein
MTAEEIYTIARQVGFPPETAVKMVAIALKESGGNPAAYNGTGPDNSYGLFQVNMIGTLGPARRQQFGLSDNSQLFDPVTNAQAAYAIWAGDDRNLDRAWAIDRGVNQTRYLGFLPTAEEAAAAVEGVTNWVSDSTGGLFPDATDEPVTPGQALLYAGVVGAVLWWIFD